jgi:hypothetical protein
MDPADQRAIMQSHAASSLISAPTRIAKAKDASLVGISKAYQTGTTAVTSNPDMSITHTAAVSAHPLPKHNFAMSNTEILNYPYAYDQDFKHEVDF